MIQFKCKVCGKEWLAKKSSGMKYCSQNCYTLSGIRIKNLPKGDTYIEMFGKDKAELKANKCAEKLRSHPDKHRLAVERGLGRARAQGGMTNVEYFGEIKAKEISDRSIATKRLHYTNEQLSEIARRSAVIQNAKFFGKKGNVCGIRTDSSYETKFVQQFYNFKEKQFSLSRANIGVYYKYQGKTRLYLPDFSIMIDGLICAIVEVKDETRLMNLETRNAWCKFIALNDYCKKTMITPCLYTNKHFSDVNPELSSVNDLIRLTNKRFVEYVTEKVQRPAVEDDQSNKTAVGQEVANV